MFHVAGSIDTVTQIEQFCVYPAACWQQGKLTVSLNLHIKCVEFCKYKIAFIAFKLSSFYVVHVDTVAQLNNSVSTQSKVTMSLHVYIKCVEFCKYKIVFVAF